jgi:uncharacterized ubiquitin-like protein YukD
VEKLRLTVKNLVTSITIEFARGGRSKKDVRIRWSNSRNFKKRVVILVKTEKVSSFHQHQTIKTTSIRSSLSQIEMRIMN